jgi:glutathione S-transferase
MKLFEFAPTRSIRARWTLQELGVDFESVVVNLLADEHHSAAFLRLNPAGRVPALVDGDVVLTESVAIVLYLAEKYPEIAWCHPTWPSALNSIGGSYSQQLNSNSRFGEFRNTRRFIPKTDVFRTM